MPLYRQIYRDIERRISTGELGYLAKVPILPELCKMYGVSEAPVRRALDELARDGLIIKQRGRGKGTVVVKRSAPATLRTLLLGDFDLYRSPIEVCHEFFDFLAGIRDTAKAAGCTVQQISPKVLENLPPPGDNMGYLIMGQGSSDFVQGIEIARRQGVPYVLINTSVAAPPCVRVDMEYGSYLGTKHLIELGHTRIAYVGQTEGEWAAPRYAGYLRAMREWNLPLDPNLVRRSKGVEASEDYAVLDALMALPTPPTAIFASSDYRALHIYSHARRRGIAVPQSLSICGYDDIAESGSIEPGLTTVYHPRQELGKAAVQMLTALIAGEKPETTDQLTIPELVIRDTTGPAPNV